MAFTAQDFELFKIKNASVQFINADGTTEPGTKFGCMGTLEQTSNIEEVTKSCEGATVEIIPRLTSAQITINAHVIIDIVREIFGLSNEGLKSGVWAYGSSSTGRKFIFTADILNMRGEESKLIAYPNCSSSGGFGFSVDNSATEVAQMQVVFNALPDEAENVYYEAIKSDLDESVATGWHTNFSRELIEATTP